jgi:hypothetical protein
VAIVHTLGTDPPTPTPDKTRKKTRNPCRRRAPGGGEACAQLLSRSERRANGTQLGASAEAKPKKALMKRDARRHGLRPRRSLKRPATIPPTNIPANMAADSAPAAFSHRDDDDDDEVSSQQRST